MKKFLNTFIFCILIFTLTLTTFSCANLLDALKDAFPPPGKAGEDIQNENPTEPNKPTTDGNENIPTKEYKSWAKVKINILGEFSDNCYAIPTRRNFTQDKDVYTCGANYNEEFYIIIEVYDKKTNKIIYIQDNLISEGKITEINIDLKRYNLEVTINGDYTKYTNPLFSTNMYNTGSIYDIPSNNFTIQIYYTDEYYHSYGSVHKCVLFSDINDNFKTARRMEFASTGELDYYISDFAEANHISSECKDATVTLNVIEKIDLLPVEEFLYFEDYEYSPTDTLSKHFRFEYKYFHQNPVFCIPIGDETDGNFIKCLGKCSDSTISNHYGHFYRLLESINPEAYKKIDWVHANQTTELHNYIKQIIDYLQDEKGLTVQNIPDFLKKDNNNNVDKPSTNEGNQGNTSGEDEGSSETPEGKAKLKLTLTGENADLYYLECKSEKTGILLEQEDGLFVHTTTENEEITVRIMLMKKENNECYTSTFTTIKDGELKEEIVEIAKYNVEVVINGDYSKYENPKISVNPIGSCSDVSEFSAYDINEKNITVFYITSNHVGPTGFVLFNDTENDNVEVSRLYNGTDYDLSFITSATYKDNNTMDAIVSLDILESINLLDESQIILGETVEYTPSDETTKYFRFEQRSDSKWTFIVPIGTGSDGDFITCYFCENNLEGHNGDHLSKFFNIIRNSNVEEFDFAQRNQTTEWHNYVKQLITYLQDEKGLTVQNIPDFLQD
ncbi:MAG: hypothetical protein UH788_08530 [Treponemataceae bacterium]|nr:hypothetical protein [Treponemataceae bacterium]